MGTPSLVGRKRTFLQVDAPPALHLVNASIRVFLSTFEAKDISPPAGFKDAPMDRTRRCFATSDASLVPPCHFFRNCCSTVLLCVLSVSAYTRLSAEKDAVPSAEPSFKGIALTPCNRVLFRLFWDARPSLLNVKLSMLYTMFRAKILLTASYAVNPRIQRRLTPINDT